MLSFARPGRYAVSLVIVLVVVATASRQGAAQTVARCGEGWLARALSACGMTVTGVDVVPELITHAARLGGGEFHVQEYRAIADRQWRGGPFDTAVCNFSLLGAESVESLLAGIGDYLDTGGHLVVQTLHPLAACGDGPYRDGWRAGNWLGFSADFADPVETALRFLGTPYLWGGRDSLGIDCSGLVQQALYAAGRTCPRDTDLQAQLGVDVDARELQRGDLVFWRGHVGMMIDAERLLHANAHHMAVAIEPLAEAVARIEAGRGGAPTGYRRV